MTSFSLICCLIAISSLPFGQAAYGSFSFSQTPSQNKVVSQNGYEQQNTGYSSSFQRDVPQQPPTSSGYGSSYSTEKFPVKPEPSVPAERTFVTQQGYGAQPSSRVFMGSQQQMFDQQVTEDTEADILCRGKLPETYIITNNGRGFIVCTADGKGTEQQCPPSLYFHSETNKCERRPTPFPDSCDSQPCLNNGVCSRLGASSFQCQCPSGFEGKLCELDARICQTRQPCGQAPGTQCQSFRVGAALSYACIFQNGRAYGPNAQQTQQNPCQGDDKPRALFFSDKGFILCDGELMYIQSCPGATLWDDSRETCDWEDMKVVIPKSFVDQPKQYGYTQSYTQQRTLPAPQTTYSAQPQTQQVESNEQRRITPSFEQPQVQSYGSQVAYQKPQVWQQRMAPVPTPQPSSRY